MYDVSNINTYMGSFCPMEGLLCSTVFAGQPSGGDEAFPTDPTGLYSSKYRLRTGRI